MLRFENEIHKRPTFGPFQQRYKWNANEMIHTFPMDIFEWMARLISNENNKIVENYDALRLLWAETCTMFNVHLINLTFGMEFFDELGSGVHVHSTMISAYWNFQRCDICTILNLIHYYWELGTKSMRMNINSDFNVISSFVRSWWGL